MKKQLINKIEELETSIKEVKTYIKMLEKQNSSELANAKKLLADIENELVELQEQL